VIPRDAISAGATNYTTLEGSDVTLSAKAEEAGRLKVEIRAGRRDERVIAFNLTFGGAYDPAASAYVVHATRAPLCPPDVACPSGGGGDGHHGGHDDDEKNWDCDPLLGPRGISDCKRVLDALPDVTYAGGTVFCPRNEGMKWLAGELGFASVDLLVADMASATGTSLLVAANYMKFLIYPDAILTRASIPDGTTVLPSLLTPTIPEANITLIKTVKSTGRVHVDLVAGAAMTDIEAYDLTFEGRYNETSDYVVHGLEDPLPVPATFASMSAFFKSAAGGGLSFTTSSAFWKPLEKKALKAASLVTLFVPTDAAWARLDKQSYTTAGYQIKNVKKSAKTKEALARFHMFNTALIATAAPGARVTASGAPVGGADKPKVNFPAAGQVTGQISAANVANILRVYQAGPYVIYAIDNVLLPKP
jgi:hypothetical protein